MTRSTRCTRCCPCGFQSANHEKPLLQNSSLGQNHAAEKMATIGVFALSENHKQKLLIQSSIPGKNHRSSFKILASIFCGSFHTSHFSNIFLLFVCSILINVCRIISDNLEFQNCHHFATKNYWGLCLHQLAKS